MTTATREAPGPMTDEVRIIHGDALEVLPTLAGEDIAAVVTDPPYGIRHASNGGPRGKASWKGTEIHGDGSTALRDWIVRWAEDRTLPWAAFGSWKVPRPKCRGVLIWDKGPAFGMGDLSFPWKMSWEEIYVGGPGWRGVRDEGVLRGHTLTSWESKGRCHPHQKPVSLVRSIIDKLPRGDGIILDPFAGSGTTPVACMKAGRRCIAIESDERWIPVIERRVSEAETPLFHGIAD